MAARTESLRDERPPEDPTPTAGTRSSRPPSVVAGYLLALVVALVPVGRMLGVVLDGSVLQHSDYWMMLPRFTDATGSLDVGGLFHFQNHPVVLPQLVYWVNLKLFAGSNITLGFFVVGLALAQLGVVALMLRRSTLRPVARMALFVLASALLFDLTGTWNFAKAMSGTAWLSANLLALVAVLLRSRDRHLPAFGAAALAAISYGTGMAAWPAVIAAGLCRRPLREAWKELPYAAGLVATVVWYRVAASAGEGADFPSPLTVLDTAAQVFAFVLGLDGALGTVVGVAALVAVPLAVIGLILSRAEGAAAWVGVAAFGWLATIEIATVRHDLLSLFGDQSRYSSLPALAWLGLAALLLHGASAAGHRFAGRGATAPAALLGSPWLPCAVVLPLLVAALAAGRDQADELAAEKADQELREVALHLGMADGTRYLVGGFGEITEVTAILEGTGHHPFTDAWDLDCGLIDQPIASRAGPERGGDAGRIEAGEPVLTLPGAVSITGEVTAGPPVRCVVITDGRDRVVGAATLDRPDPQGRGPTSFRALARSGSVAFRAYAVFEGDPRPHLLGNQLAAADLKRS